MSEEDQGQIEEVLDAQLVEHPLPTPARRDSARDAAPRRPAPGPNPGLVWARTAAAQNAMAAATGFVAGAATLALARRYGKARLERALAAVSSDPPALTTGAQRGPGRTYIVHVRPIGGEPGPRFPALGPGSPGE